MKQLKPCTAQKVIFILTLCFCAQLLPAQTRVDSILNDLNGRVLKLEPAQEHTIKQLEIANEHNQFIIYYHQFIIYALAVVIAALLGIQISVIRYQMRREKNQDQDQARREKNQDQDQAKKDAVEQIGLKKVNEIMTTIQLTLQSRLTAEEEERKKSQKLENQLVNVLGQIKPLEQFYKNFQAKIQKTRMQIEEKAKEWASAWGRHDFKEKIAQLELFAREFDQFDSESDLLEEEARTFSAQVLYIRGIAAHYANEAELAKKHLNAVIARKEAEDGETPFAFNRRVANAYYYLGVIGFNFGDNPLAIQNFEEANNRDPNHTDFLTKIVMAEAYTMQGEFDKAIAHLEEVNRGVTTLKAGNKAEPVHLRLQNRSILIRANIAYLKHKENWAEEVKGLLTPVCKNDPNYYYAASTLAQAQKSLKEDPSTLFRESYEAIRESNHLNTVKEVRSKILLLLTAAICAKHGGLQNGKRLSEAHLEEANALRNKLPIMVNDPCRVFSPLSKKNETKVEIEKHIDLIQSSENVIL